LKFRREDESAWIPANCVNIGVGGMFAVTYEPLAVGDRLDIQLLDLAPLPMELRGRVVRVRRWDDSPQLPGIAVQFELETVTADFKRLLASPDRIETLLQGCRRAELPPGALSEKTADDVR
jgi:hypothetical protein